MLKLLKYSCSAGDDYVLECRGVCTDIGARYTIQGRRVFTIVARVGDKHVESIQVHSQASKSYGEGVTRSLTEDLR